MFSNVREIRINDKTVKSIELVESGAYIFRAYEEDEVIDIPIIIEWDDQNNADLNRPESVNIHLYGNGLEMAIVTIFANDGWTGTFYECPKYDDNGYPIRYSISEDPVEWYATDITEFTVTNIYIPPPETTSAGVHVVWDDNDNYLELRPSSIVMTLSNGQEVILNEANGWSATITGLPTKVNNELVTYSWIEPEIIGYQIESENTYGYATIFTYRLTRPEPPYGGKTPSVD